MFNSVSLIGNLGNAPEVKSTPKGTQVANFSIAVNEVHTKEGSKQEKVHWFRVVAYERTAEICSQYLRKGSKVGIRGQLSYRTWESDGQRHSIVEIIAREIELLGNGAGSGDERSSTEDEPDIPF